jgi:toxin secretion/phage lysis holin
MISLKEFFCALLGALGGAVAALFGGWSSGIITLIMFMCIDYVSGIMVAGVFKNSKKTDSGALESRAGWKGLCRKGMTLIIVMIAFRLDLHLGTNYIRDAVVIGFCANEAISIIENAGLMGIPLPDALTKAIDILSKKSKE